MRHPLRRHHLRGVSLVEALVALAVMAFGMLAIVGLQSTMRLNSDVAKQRSEAVRIAQEAIEQARAYSSIDAKAGHRAWADIANTEAADVAGYTTNTTFRITREVVDLADSNQKALRITVTWFDRVTDADGGQPQRVTLQSVIAKSDPALLAALVTPPAGSPNLRPRGRHAAIPWQAKDMGDGRSAFKPPQPDGGPVVWVFNNLTGLITGICEVENRADSAAIVASDIAECSDNTVAQLLSGVVRFSTGLVQPTAADAERPTSNARNLDLSLSLTSTGHPGNPTCFDDAPLTTLQAALQVAVNYYCAIPANATRSWSGYSTVVPRRFTDNDARWSLATGDAPDDDAFRLCRYTPATSDATLVPNGLHPYLYRIEYADAPRNQVPLPMPPLTQQNFLVVRGEFRCPADVAADPAAGDFVNSNTLFHRRWP